MARESRREFVPLALVAVAAFVLATTKVTSSDAWVHLSLGRWIAHHLQVPTRNLLSHTQPERPTLDHQWLFQLSFYGLERAAGLEGAIVLKALLVAAAFALGCRAALGAGARPGLIVVVGVLAACAARFRFTLRPQVVSFLLLSGYLFLLGTWQAGRKWLLLLTIPLQVLWANFHGGAAVLGFGLLLVFAFGETVSALVARRWKRQAVGAGALALLWSVGIGCCLATLANPHGARILALPFAHAFTQATSGLKELLVDRSGVTIGELGGRHVFLAILAPLVVLALVVEVLRFRFGPSVFLLGLLAAAFTSERFVGLLAVATAHLAPEPLTRVLERLGKLSLGLVGAVLIGGVAVLIAVGLVGRNQPFGFGVAPGMFPERELEGISARFPKARLLNEFEDGGYIRWRTDREVFVDSRGLLAYSPGFMLDYVRTWTSRDVWETVVSRYGVEVALVWREPLKAMFRSSREWREVFVGGGNGRHAVFARVGPQR